MKPKRYKPEFAVAAWVEERARAFVFPDLDTIAPAGIPGGGGGAFSIQIAASDGPTIEQEKADIIADPTDGGAAIQTAADTLHEFGASASKGGRIVLGGGTFTLPAAGALSLGNNIDLEGVGTGETVLISPATSGTILQLGENCQVTGLSIVGGSGASVGVAMDDIGYVDRVHFFSLGTAIIPGDFTVVTRCSTPFPGAQPVSTFIDATSNFTNLIIAHNQICSTITLGASAEAQIIGNSILEPILANGASFLMVLGNVSQGPGAAVALTNTTDFVVANNNWGDPGGIEAMLFDTCVRGVVEGNYVGDGPDIGVLLDTCSKMVVQSNYIEFPGEHGVQLIDSDDCAILGNYVFAPSQNSGDTFDSYNIAGDRNLVMGNHTVPAGAARYGINIVSGNDNAVYANYLGDSSAYGTADSVDSGTGTQTSPAAGVIGGQFAF